MNILSTRRQQYFKYISVFIEEVCNYIRRLAVHFIYLSYSFHISRNPCFNVKNETFPKYGIISFQNMPSKKFLLKFPKKISNSKKKKIALKFWNFKEKKIILKAYVIGFHILETPHFLKVKTWISGRCASVFWWAQKVVSKQRSYYINT